MLDIIRLAFSEDLGIATRAAQFNLPPGPADYQQVWDIQKKIHAEVVSGERPNTLLLLEHQEVYTAGKRTAPHERPQDGAPVIDVDRGGKITWHGPGQLVGYPIFKLPAPVNVVGFVRAIESAIIEVCAKHGVDTVAIEGRSGVWVPGELSMDRKLCAIGLRMAKRVTMHGFALNCDNDLSWSHNVIPCGIDDALVSSLSLEANTKIPVSAVIEDVEMVMKELALERAEN